MMTSVDGTDRNVNPSPLDEEGYFEYRCKRQRDKRNKRCPEDFKGITTVAQFYRKIQEEWRQLDRKSKRKYQKKALKTKRQNMNFGAPPQTSSAHGWASVGPPTSNQADDQQPGTSQQQQRPPPETPPEQVRPEGDETLNLTAIMHLLQEGKCSMKLAYPEILCAIIEWTSNKSFLELNEILLDLFSVKLKTSFDKEAAVGEIKEIYWKFLGQGEAYRHVPQHSQQQGAQTAMDGQHGRWETEVSKLIRSLLNGKANRYIIGCLLVKLQDAKKMTDGKGSQKFDNDILENFKLEKKGDTIWEKKLTLPRLFEDWYPNAAFEDNPNPMVAINVSSEGDDPMDVEIDQDRATPSTLSTEPCLGKIQQLGDPLDPLLLEYISNNPAQQLTSQEQRVKTLKAELKSAEKKLFETRKSVEALPSWKTLGEMWIKCFEDTLEGRQQAAQNIGALKGVRTDEFVKDVLDARRKNNEDVGGGAAAGRSRPRSGRGSCICD